MPHKARYIGHFWSLRALSCASCNRSQWICWNARCRKGGLPKQRGVQGSDDPGLGRLGRPSPVQHANPKRSYEAYDQKDAG